MARGPTLRQLPLFLVIGAIVNVAVAATCLTAIDPQNSVTGEESTYRWPPPQTWLSKKSWRRFGRERIEATRFVYPREQKVVEYPGDVPIRQPLYREERGGLPMLTLALRREVGGNSNNVNSSLLAGGFILNSLFYAIILALLHGLLREQVEQRRIKRGLCPACAYPVSQSPICTECGKPVARRMTA